MPYKITPNQREIRELKKKYKGKIPFYKYATEGQRFSANYPASTHLKGRAILFNNKLYIVSKTSQKGVHLKRVLKNQNGLLDKTRLGKEIFVPEKRYSGNAVPYGMAWVFAPA